MEHMCTRVSKLAIQNCFEVQCVVWNFESLGLQHEQQLFKWMDCPKRKFGVGHGKILKRSTSWSTRCFCCTKMTNASSPKRKKPVILSIAQKRDIVKERRRRKEKILFCSQKMAQSAMKTFAGSKSPGKRTISWILNAWKLETEQSHENLRQFRIRLPYHQELDHIVYDFVCDMANYQRCIFENLGKQNARELASTANEKSNANNEITLTFLEGQSHSFKKRWHLHH